MEEQQNDESRIRQILEQRLCPGILLTFHLLLQEREICSKQGIELEALDLSTTARIRVEGDYRHGQGILYIADIKPTKGYSIENVYLEINQKMHTNATPLATNAYQLPLPDFPEDVESDKWILRFIKKPFEE